MFTFFKNNKTFQFFTQFTNPKMHDWGICKDFLVILVFSILNGWKFSTDHQIALKIMLKIIFIGSGPVFWDPSSVLA